MGAGSWPISRRSQTHRGDQCTGLFESGDSLRNIVHDYRLPIYGLVGYRSFLNAASLPGDTCLKFTEPVLDAWALDTVFLKANP